MDINFSQQHREEGDDSPRLPSLLELHSEYHSYLQENPLTDLASGLEALCSEKRCLLIGSEQLLSSTSGEDDLKFQNGLESALPLASGSCTHLGLLVTEEQATAINSAAPGELPALLESAEFGIDPDKKRLISSARQAGVEILGLRPDGFSAEEFDLNEAIRRTDFAFEKLAAILALPDTRAIVLTFEGDLCPLALELPPDVAGQAREPFIPLTSRLQENGIHGLATVRCILPENKRDSFNAVQRVLIESTEGGMYLARNEYPLSSSAHGEFFGSLADYAAVVISRTPTNESPA